MYIPGKEKKIFCIFGHQSLDPDLDSVNPDKKHWFLPLAFKGTQA
jgi:hypothetical protein